MEASKMLELVEAGHHLFVRGMQGCRARRRLICGLTLVSSQDRVPSCLGRVNRSSLPRLVHRSGICPQPLEARLGPLGGKG